MVDALPVPIVVAPDPWPGARRKAITWVPTYWTCLVGKRDGKWRILRCDISFSDPKR